MTLNIGVELDVPEKLRLDRSRGLRYLGVDRDGGSGPGQICVFVNGVVCNIDMAHRRSCESKFKSNWNEMTKTSLKNNLFLSLSIIQN